MLEEIATNVKAARHTRGLTQAQVAEGAGYEDRFIQYVEAAGRNITIDALVAIADALGVSPGSLLGADDARRPKGRPRTR